MASSSPISALDPVGGPHGGIATTDCIQIYCDHRLGMRFRELARQLDKGLAELGRLALRRLLEEQGGERPTPTSEEHERVIATLMANRELLLEIVDLLANE